MPALHRTQLFAAVVFIGSTFVLAFQVINPSPVVVSVGERGTDVAELGTYFGYRDVTIIAAAATLLGASGTYLLVPTDFSNKVETVPTTPTPTADTQREQAEPSDKLLEARRQAWEQTAERLANKEQEVYKTVLAADGVLPQSDIVSQTDLSKASVSRALDSLETKNLVERKRRGMGNMILLL